MKKRSGQIACGIVLGLISLIARSSAAQASGGIQSMTPAVGQGEMFLELEVISVKRSQIHRTFHNGIKKLIRNEYEVVCNVVKKETRQAPKAGSEITLLLYDLSRSILYDFDGKVRTDVPREWFMWPNTFWGENAKKGVKFFAAFRTDTNFQKTTYPLASRQIEERAAWDAAVTQKAQALLFLKSLSKTMPKHWKPSNKAVRVNCRPTRENIEQKVPFKPTGNPKEDARQQELREGIEYTITSPEDRSIEAELWRAEKHKESMRLPRAPSSIGEDLPVLYVPRPYISSFRFVVFKKPYGLLPHKDPLPTPPSHWYRLELPHAVVYLDQAVTNVRIGVLFKAIQKAVKLCNSPKEAAKPTKKKIETAEIVKLLETADIDRVSTKHSQTIHILLKDGTTYIGVYIHKQAGKYAKIKKCFDILNLVKHIQKERSKKEKVAWGIACE